VFAGMLQRVPSQEEFDGWGGTVNARGALPLIDAVLGIPEYARRFTP
jgi:hypothetical protein